MPVVSNTSPILNLAIVNWLSLLHEQFGEIRIPQAVLDELRVGEELAGSQSVREAIEAGWLLVEEVKDRLLVQALQRELDRGEAEVIALALQEKAEWTLLDEREGRRVAKSLGLKVTGVLGILLRACGVKANCHRCKKQWKSSVKRQVFTLEQSYLLSL